MTIDLLNVYSDVEEEVELTRIYTATLRGSRPGVQSASLIMKSLMTS